MIRRDEGRLGEGGPQSTIDRLGGKVSFKTTSIGPAAQYQAAPDAPGLVQLSPFVTTDAATAEACAEGCRAIALDAMRRHGIDAFQCPQRTATAHEAGHCVVYAATALTVTRTRIQRKIVKTAGHRFPIWLGCTQLDREDSCKRIDPIRQTRAYVRETVCTAAGFLAERRFDRFLPGSSIDERVMTTMQCRTIDLVHGWADGAAIGLIEELAETIFDAAADVHTKLTSRLFHHKLLRRRELDELLVPITARQFETLAMIDDTLARYRDDHERAKT